MDKIMFIYLKEEFGVYKFSDEFNSACVRGYLNKNRIKCEQFIEDNLVNIIDSVDDIMVDESEKVVFFIDAKNIRISKILSKEIKDNYEETQIIWFGEIESCRQYLNEEIVDVLIMENAKECLLNIAQKTEVADIMGIAYIENDSVTSTNVNGEKCEEIELYEDEVVGNSKLKELLVKGFNKDYILQGIEKLAPIAKGRLIKIETNDLLKISGIEDIVGKIGEVFLSTTINIGSLNKGNIRVLKQCPFKVVNVVIDGQAWKEGVELIAKEKDIIFNLKFVNDDYKLLREIIEHFRDMTIGEIVIRDKNSGNYRYLSVDGEKSLYKTAMLNGLNASITGFYPDNLIGNCSKHITVNKNVITDKDYEYLKDFLGLNSAVIHRTDREEGYLENLVESEKNNCYLSHYHKIDREDKIHIDDSNIMKRLNFVNYANVTTNLEDSYLRIETKEDIEALLKDAKFFKETGVIKECIAKSKIENECRWAFNGSCKLKTLARFDVNESGDVKPCRGCSKVIGNIKDGYSHNLRNVYRDMDKIHITRECSKCEINDSCSKCSMMLDTIEDSSYCSIRRSNPEISEYFIKKNILGYLINSTSTFNKIDMKDIKFSTNYTTHLFEKGALAIGKSLIQPHICMCFIGDTPILIDLNSGSLSKIGSELAFVIEGFMKGFDTQAIKDKVENIIDTETLDKDEFITSCINFLTKNNYMKAV